MFASICWLRRAGCTAVVYAAFLSVAPAEVIEFHNGIDLWLTSSNSPDPGNVNLGWGRNIGSGGNNYDALIEFTDMFGNGVDQIPLGSTINSANLYIWIGYDQNRTSSIYQMTFDWNASSTWNSIGSAGGIVPGVNTKSIPETTWTGTSNAWSQRTFDLTASVQDWSDGAGAYGWGFTRPRDATVSACSLNYSTASYRPYLAVNFTSPVPEPTTIWLAATCALALWLFAWRRRPAR